MNICNNSQISYIIFRILKRLKNTPITSKTECNFSNSSIFISTYELLINDSLNTRHQISAAAHCSRFSIHRTNVYKYSRQWKSFSSQPQIHSHICTYIQRKHQSPAAILGILNECEAIELRMNGSFDSFAKSALDFVDMIILSVSFTRFVYTEPINLTLLVYVEYGIFKSDPYFLKTPFNC